MGSLAGAAFSHYVLFPSMMSFFATFTVPGVRFEPRIEYVFELYSRSLVGMVLAPASRTTAQAPAQAPPPTRVRARWLRPVAA